MAGLAAEVMAPRARNVAQFLKGLANADRLMILCQLLDGDQCVSDLIAATGIAPTSMSQHLAKLREQDIISVRREHRTLIYSLSHIAALDVMSALYKHFCGVDDA